MTTTSFGITPSFAERVWGKTDLRPWYAVTGIKPIGEAWLTGPACLVATGEHAGKTVTEAFGSEFPLLVKMLFPADKLSVQVHPNDAEAQALGLDRGKTECWYVLEAEPGATVACGLREGVTVADLEAAVHAGTAENLMQMLPVAVGDMVFVDAGTVHAIGPGLTLLEVQQTCDITYRLYDYGRPRELHLEAGLAVVKTATAAGKVAPQPHDGFIRLIETEYFIVDRFQIEAGHVFELKMDGPGCVVGLRGTGAVDAVRFQAGEAVLCANGSMVLSSEAGCDFLRCWQPQDVD